MGPSPGCSRPLQSEAVALRDTEVVEHRAQHRVRDRGSVERHRCSRAVRDPDRRSEPVDVHRRHRRETEARGLPPAGVGPTERPGDAASETALGSAELFGERDDDAVGAAEVAEPIQVLVLRDLADEIGAMRSHASYDVVDVVDGEHDAA